MLDWVSLPMILPIIPSARIKSVAISAMRE